MFSYHKLLRVICFLARKPKVIDDVRNPFLECSAWFSCANLGKQKKKKKNMQCLDDHKTSQNAYK